MLPGICIVICLICWGLWGILDKKALERSSSQSVIVTQYLMHAAQVPVCWLVLNQVQPGWQLTAPTMFWSGLASVAYIVALVGYLTAMSKTDASLVLGTTACYPVLAVGLATLLLGEPLVVWRVIGAAIVCGGVMAMSWPARQAQKKQRLEKIVIGAIITATIAWAIMGLIDKAAVNVAAPLEVCLGKFIWDIVLLPIIYFMFKRQGHEIRIIEKQNLIFCGASTFCLAAGTWSYLSALSVFPASYVIAITACYPVLMYLLAVVFLKEKFNNLRAFGILLIVLGGACVQLGQPEGPEENIGIKKTDNTLQNLKTPNRE